MVMGDSVMNDAVVWIPGPLSREAREALEGHLLLKVSPWPTQRTETLTPSVLRILVL